MWEYKMIDLYAKSMGLYGKVDVGVEQILNEMGLQGWELISIDKQTCIRDVAPSGFAYFKRPLK